MPWWLIELYLNLTWKGDKTMSPQAINILTNIVGALFIIVGAAQGYLTSQPFSWPTFLVCIMAAVVSWYTGKGSIKLEKMLKKAGKLALIFFIMAGFVGLSGCASTWQAKATTGYLTSGIGLTAAEKTVKPPCDAGQLKPADCDSLKVKYAIASKSYIAAGNVLILALTTTDAIQEDSLRTQLDTIIAQFQTATTSLIDLIQQIEATQTNTAMPPKIKKLSPEIISIIISGLSALIEAIPNIIDIFSITPSQTDINALVKQIQDAQASLPVW